MKHARHLGLLFLFVPITLFAATVGGPVSPSGKEIDCDLPGDLHVANVTSRGQGCCVFRSLHHAAQWQNVPHLVNFPEWLQTKGIAGGGTPSNARERIKLISQDKKCEEPLYVNYEGTDVAILQLACKTGRMPCVTYALSPTGRYKDFSGRNVPVRHMVNLVAISDSEATILDNNFPGADQYEHVSLDEFKKSWTYWGKGWAIILLNPPPPMPPKNRSNFRS